MSGDGTFGIGKPAPPLELPDTTGEIHTLPEPGEAPASVVIWTSNHCPYAIAWQERLMAAARDFSERDVRFLAVNSNDAERYPADSLEAMRTRVEAGEFACPYLHDGSQDAVRDWGAKTTPDVFVLDGDLRLRYRGAPDADFDDPSQGAAWLRAALDAVLAGAAPDPAETESVGCSVKWKQ
ncbi:MAG: thioredoxin family protein [Solirubrobacterales bacterium]|nr:thioredoxin family protein [Solirubrobacterales bacterium]